MNGEKDKYNNTKARYIAYLIVQNRYNKNRGVSYLEAVRENISIREDIDFWIDVIDSDGERRTDEN